MKGQVYALLVGQPRRLEEHPAWITAFFKEAVFSPVFLSRANLDGDRQADLSVHGGADKAVCVYPAQHYAAWARELLQNDCGPGWFGENLTVLDQSELAVCIGDVYRIGSAIVQVSQPRGPCWKLGRRWHRPDLPKRVVQSGRSGWYLRVLEEGNVAVGESLVLLDRPHKAYTIEFVNRVTYARGATAGRATEDRFALATCMTLAERWRAGLLD